MLMGIGRELLILIQYGGSNHGTHIFFYESDYKISWMNLIEVYNG